MEQTLYHELWTIPAVHITNEQEFTSPGTWTCPSTTTWVEVIAVGGGGGGGGGMWQAGIAGPPGPGGGGGGGAVVRKWVPVTGPVPITVGSGGAGGSITIPGVPAPAPPYVYVAAQSGGTTGFGPLTPPVPSLTVQAGGGGFGGGGISPGNVYPGVPVPWAIPGNAPTYGGGGGGATSGPFYLSPEPATWGQGYWGAPGTQVGGGGARGSTIPAPNANAYNGIGYGIYGGGGQSNPNYNFIGSFGGGASGLNGSNGTANTGGGGGAGTAGPSPAVISSSGGNGGSGIVIVRWRQ